MNLETPFPYQLVGADFLAANPHALLADEMGLGKSAQVIRACDLVGAQNILIVCPAAVRVNWEREFQRFSPFDRPASIIETGKDRPKDGVNIVSYDLLAANEKVRQACRDRRWDVLALDEAHYLKERSAKRTKAIYGHNKHPGIAHSAKRVWPITGTPAPNNASEMYPHLKHAGLTRQSYWDFVYTYCDGFDSDYGYKITGHRNVHQFRQLLSGFMLRRKKEEVMTELPPITFHTVTVDRSKVELDPYFYENWRPIGVEAFLQQLKDVDTALKTSLALQREGHHHNANDALTLLASYAKTTATLRRYIGLAKTPRVCEILEEELASGALEKVVIFCVHQQVIEMCRQKFRKYNPVTLFGGTPAKKRQENIDAFQKDPRCRVFIGQIQAAGTGITLTAAHEVVMLESSWVPADNAQAAMRCHRVGQTKPVRVRMFVCAGSVDEQVMRVVANKTREITKIVD